MTKLFVQWMLGQFLVVEVTYFENYYIEMEVLYPYPGIKADYFSESLDFTKDENAWIIKNFINRNVEAHLRLLFCANEVDVMAKCLEDESSEEVYEKFAIDLIHDTKNDWWEESYMKYFSTKTITSLSKHIQKYLKEGIVDFKDNTEYIDREDEIDKMMKAIIIKNPNELYFFLCVRRFNKEVNSYYRKIEPKITNDYKNMILVALHESYYSYPDCSYTTESLVLIQYYNQLSESERNELKEECRIDKTWNPYQDIVNKKTYEWNPFNAFLIVE